jgi:signal transduction histidine kinase
LAKIKLSTLDDLSLPVESKKSLAEIEQLVEQAELSTRTLTFQIYNPALHDLGFEPAVEWLAQNIQESYGLKVDLADNGKHKPMDGPLRVVMFQCLREVLINVAKHAKVDRARVDIAHRHHFVRVTIEDLGVGFDSQDSPDKNRGFGLFSIRERITQLGGQVEVKSSPGRGTMVILEGPISTDNHKTTRNRP